MVSYQLKTTPIAGCCIAGLKAVSGSFYLREFNVNALISAWPIYRVRQQWSNLSSWKRLRWLNCTAHFTMKAGEIEACASTEFHMALRVEDTIIFVQNMHNTESHLHLIKPHIQNTISGNGQDRIGIRRLTLVSRRALMDDETTSPGKYINESTDIHLLVPLTLSCWHYD